MKIGRKKADAALAVLFEKRGGVMTVKPEGHLDTATSPLLEKELKQHLNNATEIIMDFANVEYISSAGLRVILSTERLLEGRGGSMKLTHVNQHIIEIFELVGFLDVVTVEQD